MSTKQFITLVGQRISARWLARLDATMNYVKVGHWMAKQGYRFEKRVKNRREVWDSVAGAVSNQQVLYLEFGVAGGDSMRYWSKALKHPDSLLHGFDSFEGLPESGGHWRKGQFSTGGAMPELGDARVTFFKGWFDQVMPEYSMPRHDLLIVNMDADLYSSTIFVLRSLRPHIQKGTLVYFDDMNHPDHEVRALEEFAGETNIKLRPISADKSLTHVFFECVDPPLPPSQ